MPTLRATECMFLPSKYWPLGLRQYVRDNQLLFALFYPDDIICDKWIAKGGIY